MDVEIKRAAVNTTIDRHFRYSPSFSQELGEFVMGRDGLEMLCDEDTVVRLYQEEYIKIDLIYRELYNRDLSDEDNMIVTKCVIEFSFMLVIHHYSEILAIDYDMNTDHFIEYYKRDFEDYIDLAVASMNITYPNLEGKLPDKLYDLYMYVDIMMDIYYTSLHFSEFAIPIGWVGKTNIISYIGV